MGVMTYWGSVSCYAAGDNCPRLILGVLSQSDRSFYSEEVSEQNADEDISLWSLSDWRFLSAFEVTWPEPKVGIGKESLILKLGMGVVKSLKLKGTYSCLTLYLRKIWRDPVGDLRLISSSASSSMFKFSSSASKS